MDSSFKAPVSRDVSDKVSTHSSSKSSLSIVSSHMDSEIEDTFDKIARDDKESFSSRWAFWLAAIGCAVGFGNLWRFPYLVYSFGGAAFLIPYALALIFVGIPVAVLEFGVGQLAQGGHVKAFGAIHPRGVAVGFGCMISFCSLMYDPLLLAWCMLYIVNSFKRVMPWIVSDEESAHCTSITSFTTCELDIGCLWKSDTLQCEANLLNEAIIFFEVNLSAKPDYWTGIEYFNYKIWLAEVFTLTIVLLGAIGGAKIIGYVNYITTTLPALCLIVLLGFGLSLEGASKGVDVYIGSVNFSTLGTSAVWTAACGQTLFSLGTSQGTMAGYAAHNKRSQNFVQDTYIVAFADTMFAFIAGFVVFSVVGFLSTSSGIPIEDLQLSGRGLAFQTYPAGIGAALGYPGANILTCLFFLMLWLLGISTEIGLLEALGVVIVNSKLVTSYRKSGGSKWHVYSMLIAVMFLFTFLYSTDMGLHFLNALDYFLGTFGYTFVAGCEGLIGGWFSDWDRYLHKAGWMAVYIHLISYLVALVGGCLLLYLPDASVGQIAGPSFFAGVFLIGLGVALGLTNKVDDEGNTLSIWRRLYNLTLWNTMQLRNYMNRVACKDTIWRVPRAWSFVLKYIAPTVTAVLTIGAATDPYQMFQIPRASASDPLPNYQWWVFLLGATGPLIVAIGVVAFFFLPWALEWIAPPGLTQFRYVPKKRLDVAKDHAVQSLPDRSVGSSV